MELFLRVDVRLRDETKMTERLEELVLEQKRLHEEMLARQRAEFHKDNAKLLNQLRAESEAKPASGSSYGDFDICFSSDEH